MSLFWTEQSWGVKKERGEKTERPAKELNTIPRRVIDSDWVRPNTMPDLTGDVVFDVETNDPGLLDTGSKWAWRGVGYIAGVAVASAGFSAYYPLRHDGDGNMENPEQVKAWLRAQVLKPDVNFIAANAAYDIGWMERELEIEGQIQRPIDVLGAAAILNENRPSYSLDALAKEYLGLGKDTDLLYEAGQEFGFKNVMQNIHRMPPAYVGPYAERDAVAALELWNKLKPQLEAEALTTIFELECDVLRVAIDMRRKGVLINTNTVEQSLAYVKEQEQQALAKIRDLTGIGVSPWEAESLGKALEAAGYRLHYTQRGQPSITKAWLESLPGEVPSLIRDARRWSKARTTFLEGHLMRHCHNGRIHAEFNPLRREDDEGGAFGTITGRFSSSNPNLQQIPVRDPEVADQVRACFEPEQGEQWVVFDYANQEPRLTLHMAHKIELVRPDLVRGTAELVEKFQQNPRLDLHMETAERMNVDRRDAKTINLGITYGMMGKKLCAALGLPTTWEKNWRGEDIEVAGAEGAALLQRHKEAMPYLTDIFDVAMATAKDRGVVRTILGRRCRFHKGDDGRYWYTHKALNKSIQGSAADQVKKAMVALHRAGFLPMIQVHDELDFSLIGETKQLREIRDIMETVIPLVIPVRIDIKMGSNWAAITGVPDERQ